MTTKTTEPDELYCEDCTDDCEGCRNPVAALIHDRNAARGLAYQRGRELDMLQSRLESAGSLNAALREQLAEARTWIDRKNAAIETWQQQAKENAAQLAQVTSERDALKRGEFICQRCHLRKDAEFERGDF